MPEMTSCALLSTSHHTDTLFNWLRKEGVLAQATEKAIARLEEVFPDHNHKNRILWRTYLPHVRLVLESEAANKGSELRMDLMWRYGLCLYQDGRWDESEELQVQLIEIRKEKLGADHPSTLTSMANLAFMWEGQGRVMEAISLLAECVQRQKRVLGINHPDSISSLRVLAR